MTKLMIEKGKPRHYYLDVLRVLAAFCVVIPHATSVTGIPQGSVEWWIGIAYDCLSRWTVPIFVMISGTLFLSSKPSIKKIYTKSIVRLVTAFLFWSILYAFITDPTANVAGFIADVIYGHYHMWYLYMIIGLYIVTPLIGKITESEELTKYFLIVAFVVVFLLPEISLILKLFPSISILGELIDVVLGKSRISLVGGFSTYYILGYYLHTHPLSKRTRVIVYCLGILAAVITLGTIGWVRLNDSTVAEAFLDGINLNNLLLSVAIFVFIKNTIGRESKFGEGCSKISKYCFGEYLVHAMVLAFIKKELESILLVIPMLFRIPLLSFVVFFVSMAISYVLKKIPVLKSYIV